MYMLNIIKIAQSIKLLYAYLHAYIFNNLQWYNYCVHITNQLVIFGLNLCLILYKLKML